ncbi:TauD/TfdA family dioxygenase [Streptomyces sp. NPDC092952]|uniref:TauD/TfdA family dioxygenase n=1 Tax=Streptomyces sp. NPDC092952 TaxID=3366018 RepID=UPI003823768D
MTMKDLAELRAWKPYEITADTSGSAPGSLPEFLASHDNFNAFLTEKKAIVFRGFSVAEDSLDPVLDQLLPNRLAYVHGNSPRTKVGSNVYTSTEYPQEFTISMHNELSYGHRWPSRLVFYCATAPATGGATTVVDGELWLASLEPEVREAFAGGVRYNQNLHDGIGLGKSWQDTFETDDRAAVEAFLKEAEAEWSWQPDGALRITQIRRSTLVHPESGTEVWFNQSDQWHPASLGDETAAELAQILPAEELPQSVTFADGTPIPDAYVLQVRDRGLENAVDVNWAQGDLLVIDNVAVGHGRGAFTGDRRILVAMTD